MSECTSCVGWGELRYCQFAVGLQAGVYGVQAHEVASRLLPVFFCTFWVVWRELLVVAPTVSMFHKPWCQILPAMIAVLLCVLTNTWLLRHGGVWMYLQVQLSADANHNCCCTESVLCQQGSSGQL